MLKNLIYFLFETNIVIILFVFSKLLEYKYVYE